MNDGCERDQFALTEEKSAHRRGVTGFPAAVADDFPLDHAYSKRPRCPPLATQVPSRSCSSGDAHEYWQNADLFRQPVSAGREQVLHWSPRCDRSSDSGLLIGVLDAHWRTSKVHTTRVIDVLDGVH